MNPLSQHISFQRNHKLILFWIVGLLIMSALSGCDSLDDTSDVETSGTLHVAQNYLNQGQYRAASIEVRNAIQKEPQNVKARVLMAKILLAVGQPLTAISQLEAVSGGSDIEYVTTLSEAYIKRNKYHSSKEILDTHSKELKNNAAFEFHLLMSQTLAGLGETQKAKRHFEIALSEAGNNSSQKLQALIGYARISLDKGDESAAINYLDQALSIKNDPEALLLKGSIAYKQGNLEQAENQLSNALIELPSTDIIVPLKTNILQGLIQTLTQLGRSNEALIYSRLLAETTPNSEENQNKFTKALELFKQGKMDEAEKLMSEIYSGTGNEYTGRMLGLINAIQGDLTEADDFLSAHVDPETASSKVVRILAETKLRLNQTDEALLILEEKASQSPDDPEILSIYGLALLTAGQTDKAVNIIQKALSIQPVNPRLRVALAKFHISQKETGKAKEQLSTAYESNPENHDIVVALGKLYFASGEPDKARDLSRELLQKSPDSAFAHAFAGAIAFAARDFSRAINHYKQSNKLDTDNMAPRFGLARAYIGQGDYIKAISELEAVIESAPNDPQVYKAFVAAHELNQSVDQALAKMQLISEKNIQAWAPLAVLAEYHIHQRKPDKAVNLAEQALARNAIEAYPKNIAMAAYHMAATKALHLADHAKAREHLLQALQLAPDDIRFLAMLTATEIRSKRLGEAAKIIQQLESTHPGTPVAMELRGDILLTEEKPEKALALYEQAWEKAANDSLGNKIYRMKLRANAASPEFLQRWQESIPNSLDATLLLAMDHQKNKKFEEAMEQYKKALEIDPDSLTATNNLAWLMFEHNKPGALAIAEEGARKHPDSAEMLDTYGWILARSGEKVKARKILDRARKLAPDNTEIRKHYEAVQ